MTEQRQVQAIVDAGQLVANELSLTGQHLAAANVQALIQLVRVLWTRLQPPAEVPNDPPKLEAI